MGLNYGAGVHVNLRLRRSNHDGDLNFYPFHQVLDAMLHELCHNVYYHHNASFYELWDELRKEYKELMAKGITGTAEGEEEFDLPGRRLGGDSVIMTALSSAQAAAMAAEQRLQDEIWFGLDHVVDYEVAENIVHKLKTDNSALPSNLLSRKRSLSVNSASSTPNFVDLTMEHQTGSKRRCSGPPSGDNRNLHSEESGMWECMNCTLLNKSLDPICEVCDMHQPKHVGTTWSCKFCTLENNVKLDKCSACDQWRYSIGPAV